MQTPIRLVLMGTGPFAVPSFEALAQSGHNIVLVVTRPMPPVKSRGGAPDTPVRDWATRRNLPLSDPDSINDDEAIERVRAADADLMVVCDYGQILKPAALAATRWGGINLHGSLLPAYRGAAPVQRAMLAGERETGVSVIHMTPRLDGGPILSTRSTTIRDQETAGELEHRLSEIGVSATLQSIDDLIRFDGQVPGAKTQDASLVTKAARLSKAEGQIEWSRRGREIDVHVRGMQPWPVAFTHCQTRPGKPPVRINVLKVRIEVDAAVDPDQIGRIVDPAILSVGCGDGVVILERVQPAGKKPMDAIDFLRGNRLSPGTPLQ